MVCLSINLKFASIGVRVSLSEANRLSQTGASAAVCYVKAWVD